MFMICIPRADSGRLARAVSTGAPCYDFCRDVSMRIRYKFGFFLHMGPRRN